MAIAVAALAAAVPGRGRIAVGLALISALGISVLRQEGASSPPFAAIAQALVREGWRPSDPVAVPGIFTSSALEWYHSTRRCLTPAGRCVACAAPCSSSHRAGAASSRSAGSPTVTGRDATSSVASPSASRSVRTARFAMRPSSSILSLPRSAHGRSVPAGWLPSHRGAVGLLRETGRRPARHSVRVTRGSAPRRAPPYSRSLQR